MSKNTHYHLVPHEEILKKHAAPCGVITPDDLKEIEFMISVMVQNKAVGIAAPQVGINKRMFIMNPTGRPEDRTLCINPVMTRHGNQIVKSREGCINFPEKKFVTVDRWAVIDVEYITVTYVKKWYVHKVTMKHWPAIVYQHLMEYLDGPDNQVIKILMTGREDANQQTSSAPDGLKSVDPETKKEA